MNTIRQLVTAITLTAALSACGGKQPPPAQQNAHQPETFIGKAVKEVTDEAKEELQNGNIDVSGDKGGLPKAEITPKGDLLIEGQPVAIDATQRALLLEYRAAIVKIVNAAIDVGTQGADLAGKAVTEAISGIFSGDQQTFEQRVEKKLEAEAEKIEISAKNICVHLPSLLSSQQKLAAAIPEFRPYAQMTQRDVDECNAESAGIRHNIEMDKAPPAYGAQNEIRENIRENVRTAIRESLQQARDDVHRDIRQAHDEIRGAVTAGDDLTQDAAAEAEAASAESAKTQAPQKK
ncbi:MAG: DUF2884 family protein [Lysobacteraceae bacterium]|nr:MAG: DUF2884 family protein [Xanthomonadaceae bacterium]